MKFKSNTVNAVVFLALAVVAVMGQSKFDQKAFDQALAQVKQTGENETALLMIKSNLPDYYPSEIAALIKYSYPAVNQEENKVIRVLPFVREHLITDGKDFDQVQKVAGDLFQFMWLKERIRIVYFDSPVPVTVFSYPNAIMVSSAAAKNLTDDELEGVLAHEITHLIIFEQFKKAVDDNNLAQLRALEIFCDAAGIAILQAKGKNPMNLVTGLEKMQQILSRETGDRDDGSKHPTLRRRKEFCKNLIQKVNIAVSKK